MLRLTELKLPLGHPPEAIRAAVIERLGIGPADLVEVAVARRAHDARKKSAVLMIYSVDATVGDEAEVLARLAGDHRVRPTPDTEYRFVAHAPATPFLRPLVVGAGPCG